MVLFGWLDLALVFLGEVLTVAAFTDWGHHHGGWPMAIVALVVTVVGWWLFASPRAVIGDTLRDGLKAAILLLASAALWQSGHEVLAVVLLVYNAVVNAIAQLPSIKVLAQP